MAIHSPKGGGLTAQLKQKLIQQALERKLKRAGADEVMQPAGRASGAASGAAGSPAVPDGAPIPEAFYRFDMMPAYQQLQIMSKGAEHLGIPSPYFKVHEGISGDEARIGDRDYINYASYDYLGMSRDPVVMSAAKDAIDRYGTSVSASRILAGERPIHQELEQAMAQVYDCEDAVTFVSGHATNVSTIGQLFGPRDLVLHDELVHNSVVVGIQLSGAHRVPFAHNDWQAVDELLVRQRRQFERVLIVLEGLYGMDGDIPDLPRFVEVKNRHKAFLMVDEAHSFGVLGERGYGLREHFGMRGSDVDIWMGTFSKAMAGCGGYIAGEKAMVEHLRYLAPGFLYSVGMAPSLTAGSLAALRCMQAEPQRVAQLQARGQYFLREAQAAGLDTGTSIGMSVIPVIVGASVTAAKLSAALFKEGINAMPILYPAVPEKSARLRFFMSCLHTTEQIDATVGALRRLVG
ncbi:aminotransferase class I/II-fold pyridoxal phosphate-dependent enzyme [Allopusillimonas soli]|uniref:Aminotransferase class I/II-fold pyridoxal phosphate-dependent enzyme n=1 Tax=Allopusillimonas soli TaxID=659016 RepID=A0A853F8K8_9BURK|nr:aminotransferase class I/II-fold pyridoxal phosphate-dependent enzyme [Allopusillimonas soli]NYT36433.1 aminotransferase class I/II-fold pyridoxal phosphate-dependent enzyme [Allopusillimonas soli]TEA74943.1 aminotransferase class I/II-fold pyridoxal phosphate-dependent enzyme [Allopusillimonas soli]